MSNQLTLHDHIRELRRRLVWSCAALLVGGGVGFGLHTQIIVFLKKPIEEPLYYSSPAGGFNFIMKVCFLLGIALALPVLIYNLIKFIQPAFEGQIRNRQVHLITFMSVLLALGGAAFSFFLMVPICLHFFANFDVAGVKPLISANDYLSFVLNNTMTFMLIFQIPLLLLFIDKIRPLPPQKLLKYNKYVIVLSLAVAALLPFTYDPLSQLVLATPGIVLYNLSIGLLWVIHRRRAVAPQLVLEAAELDTKEEPVEETLEATPSPVEEPVLRAELPEPLPPQPEPTAPVAAQPVIRPVAPPRLIMDIRKHQGYLPVLDIRTSPKPEQS
jgi:sec-independent protein translocase protein TatC